MKKQDLFVAGWEVYPPITENTPNIDLIDGVLSFAFHNAGTNTAILNDHWTVLPGAFQQLTVFQPNMVVEQKLKVAFTGVGTNNLQISAMRIKGRAWSNFSGYDPTD